MGQGREDERRGRGREGGMVTMGGRVNCQLYKGFSASIDKHVTPSLSTGGCFSAS